MTTTRQFQTKADAAQFITESVKAFAQASPLNCMPGMADEVIFDEPLVQFADGDDPIFAEYKTIINPVHMTPRAALARTIEKSPDELSARLSVISWVLPITEKTRESNRQRKDSASRRWAYTRWYGEKFNDALREHVVALLTEASYLAVAPVLQPFFKTEFENVDEKGYYSNWSERHIAYAAGLGTFSLSDGFISERGIALRCGSVVTDLALPVSPRAAEGPYSNCLFYAGVNCRACIIRCPGGAITEEGHDKLKCRQYMRTTHYLLEEYQVGIAGCGLCQTKVPCEFRNPIRKLKAKVG